MRSIAIVTAGIGFVVAAACWPVDAKSPRPAFAARFDPPPAARVTGLEIGDEHVYGLTLVQEAADLTVALEGTWAVAYAGEDERGLVFRAQLRDGRPSVRRASGEASAAEGPLVASLGQAHYFTTTSEGRLIAMHFAPGTDELSRGALSTIASLFQVSRRRALEWDAVETDSLGDYEVRYTRTDVLRRRRIRYTDPAIDATVVGTGTEIAMRADGWPAKIAGAESTRIGTDELAITVATRFTLEHEASSQVHAGWYDGLEVAPIRGRAGVDPGQADRELVDGALLADLLAALAETGDDAHARGYQFLRVAALLRLEPEAVVAAARAVHAGHPAASALIAALGEAGTPEAQRALAGIVTSELGDEPRTHAAISLGLTEAPTGATLNALASATRGEGDLAASATLAQGNAALRMRDEDPSAADRLVDELLARLARATTDDERVLVLRALGNTGHARIVPAVEHALAGGGIAVRAAATEALRLVAGADPIIVARLGDRSAIVRAAAVFAASERDLAGYAEAFAAVVRGDPEVDVRRAVVELAAARIHEHAALRDILAHAAAHDPDAELRAVAKSLLEQPGKPV